MKKKQIIIETAIVVSAFLCCLLLYFFLTNEKDQGKTVNINGDGNVIASYPISIDRLILVYKDGDTYILNDGITEDYDTSAFPPHRNLIRIKDDEISVIEADCPAKGFTRCTNQRKIKYSGKSIICRENGLVITVSGGGNDGTDASSR